VRPSWTCGEWKAVVEHLDLTDVTAFEQRDAEGHPKDRSLATGSWSVLTTSVHLESGFHPGLAMAGNVAVDRVLAGLEF
jgi:hypothetical protein